MMFSIPVLLRLGTRMSDPYVYVVFWALATDQRLSWVPQLPDSTFKMLGFE